MEDNADNIILLSQLGVCSVVSGGGLYYLHIKNKINISIYYNNSTLQKKSDIILSENHSL